MRIILFLDDKLLEFRLPREISGNFSFDYEDTDSMLINVEAKEGAWYLCNTSDVMIVEKDSLILSKKLEVNQFYTLRRDNKNYLIYTIPLFDHMDAFSYDNLNIVFGSSDECNVKYMGLSNKASVFSLSNKEIVISGEGVYLNDKIARGNVSLKFGDKVSYYGFRLVFLNNIILFNNPNNQIVLSDSSGLKNFSYSDSDSLNKDMIKDRELYSDSMYFSKSPRIKRFISQKQIKLSPPPENKNEDDLPLIIVIGPMLTMAITSLTMLLNTIVRLNNGTATMADSWPQLLTGGAMLLSTLLWPIVTKVYNKKRKIRKALELEDKYNKYILNNRIVLESETKLQHDILLENIISLRDCDEQINKRGVLFWNKRNDDKDFLLLRAGYGDAKLDVNIEWPEEGFTVDEDKLRTKMESLIKEYEYIHNVPIGYSLYDNNITAVMGDEVKSVNFVNNLILQLLTFYSYEDIKLVVFTNEKNKDRWEYIRYLNHNLSNDKSVRFFSSNSDNVKFLSEFFNYTVKVRENSKDDDVFKPYYIFIVDDYALIKKCSFIKSITESSSNLGFSMLILENRLSRLPSKCNNFISLTGKQADILINRSDSQEQIKFTEEINYNLNMMNYTKRLSNIPIEFEEGLKQLPESINFLEMQGVSKVSALNILNRWNTLDPTVSLKAAVGVDEQGDLLYLDLHEKFHGPHGLIAGTTGSGKSEFIITYILSMAINYSPEYVSFILIDYKGGGLAFAFENKTTGESLPHLAGTITNLDKAEMDRTLVSIDSEIKRRQAMFNEARDNLGESTIDIYKYQRFYRDGKVKEAIPHLFIVCDEFAELKAQQPDFMDNLISVARIGRSLGVHLILATQKPSGVVNDQIWSNTKFRVCLKVADEADSKEMLKRPEAAYIKQTGRFYLQVGMDELFLLGQSGWCGAKYFPSDKLLKQVDKSINFINDCGSFIKSIQAATSMGTSSSDQLSAVMGEIISLANGAGKRTKRLWLENIPQLILVDNLIKKYNVSFSPYDFKAVLGEYDAPEKQEQGLLLYDYLEDGNTIIYGLDSSEREMLLSSMIYSSVISHSPSEINFYVLDYGSESLRKFNNFPHVGGMVFASDDDKYKSFFELIKKELKTRKKLFANYGGEYVNYNKNSGNKVPLKVIIFNNYDSIYENNQALYDILPDLVRDSVRYGVVFIFTANNVNSISNRISQNFDNIYTFKLKDMTDYATAFGTRKKISPRDIFGRGLVDNGEVHEFQTSSITSDEDGLNDYLINIADSLKAKYSDRALVIPELPNKVTFDLVGNMIRGISSIPIGISKDDLDVVSYDFTSSVGTIITSNKLRNVDVFLQSLLLEFSRVANTDVLFVDGVSKLASAKNICGNYYNDGFDLLISKFSDYLDKTKSSKGNQIIVIYGLDKFISKLSSPLDMNKLLDKVRGVDSARIIILDDALKIKQYAFEGWFSKNFSITDGIWVGRGFADQNVFKTGIVKKEYLKDIKNDLGFYISEGVACQLKFIDFTKKEGE